MITVDVPQMREAYANILRTDLIDRYTWTLQEAADYTKLAVPFIQLLATAGLVHFASNDKGDDKLFRLDALRRMVVANHLMTSQKYLGRLDEMREVLEDELLKEENFEIPVWLDVMYMVSQTMEADLVTT